MVFSFFLFLSQTLRVALPTIVFDTMVNKQFILSGKDNGRVTVISVSASDALVDLKCRVASVFDIASVEGKTLIQEISSSLG